MKYTLDELNKMVDEANENDGYLDLSGLTSIPEGFNPTVGGWLDLRGLTSNFKRLKDGDYVPNEYIYCDGILTHISGEAKKGEYIFYKGKIPGINVISDGENFAHCKSFKDGVCDLAFKKASDRGAEQYESLTFESKLTLEEATTAYRIITGACRAGTEQFIQSLGDKVKDAYTVQEMIEVTQGQYGSSVFKEFFKRKQIGD